MRQNLNCYRKKLLNINIIFYTDNNRHMYTQIQPHTHIHIYNLKCSRQFIFFCVSIIYIFNFTKCGSKQWWITFVILSRSSLCPDKDYRVKPTHISVNNNVINFPSTSPIWIFDLFWAITLTKIQLLKWIHTLIHYGYLLIFNFRTLYIFISNICHSTHFRIMGKAI